MKNDVLENLIRYKCNPYPFTLHLTTSREVFSEVQRLLGQPVDDIADSVGVASFYGHQCLIGWFNGKHSTLAHECMHVIFKVMEGSGIFPDPQNDEPYCYLLSHMMDSLDRQVRKRKKRESRASKGQCHEGNAHKAKKAAHSPDKVSGAEFSNLRETVIRRDEG